MHRDRLRLPPYFRVVSAPVWLATLRPFSLSEQNDLEIRAT